LSVLQAGGLLLAGEGWSFRRVGKILKNVNGIIFILSLQRFLVVFYKVCFLNKSKIDVEKSQIKSFEMVK
jgi:hypothetical protein